MTDQPDVIPVADGLCRLSAFRGAAQILFNAALQRQAAEVRQLTEWTPQGRLPLRRKAAKHSAAANDHGPDLSSTA